MHVNACSGFGIPLQHRHVPGADCDPIITLCIYGCELKSNVTKKEKKAVVRPSLVAVQGSSEDCPSAESGY